MKVLTLKQPWATLISEGLKEYEFRSWNTNYRGKLLIHAGISCDKEELKKFNYDYPKSRIVALVELIDCIKIDDKFNKMIKDKNSIVYGNKDREGYAWKIKLIKRIDDNKEVKGRLGLWNIEDYEIK